MSAHKRTHSQSRDELTINTLVGDLRPKEAIKKLVRAARNGKLFNRRFPVNIVEWLVQVLPVSTLRNTVVIPQQLDPSKWRFLGTKKKAKYGSLFPEIHV